MNSTVDEGAANGTLTTGAALSDTLTLSSGSIGRLTGSLHDAIYIISATKYVLMDENTSDTAPVITIVETQ